MNFLSKDHLKKSMKEVCWQDYLKKWENMTLEDWILRGQSCQGSEKISLMSGLERALTSYDIPFSKAPEIEEWMIREFQRKYKGMDSHTVNADTLYCLSLMQHHGCPTRLLDFTYSPYIAAFFAVADMSVEQRARREAFVFCFSHKWINQSARKNIDDDLFRKRFDKTVKEESFKPLYMEKKGSFIVAENPHQLHERLSIQKGVFIIQGDITKKLMQNIELMNDWQSEENVIIYKLKIDTGEELKKIYEDLRLMNITHESLFPGLQGFGKSFKQNLYWYRDLREIKDGVNPYTAGNISKRSFWKWWRW
jgi:hypothetical protein